jgi:hypothetical protein
VIVKYAALRRIDVEANMKADATTPRRQIDVGSLLIQMLEPGTGKELFHGRVDKPIDTDPEQLTAAINAAVADVFAKYPTRTKK